MITMRMSRRRLSLTVIAVFAFVAVFVIRLVDIQLVQAEQLTQAADSRQVRTVTTYGVRGNIVDGNGVVLADSVDRFDITASPKSAVPQNGSAGFVRTAKDGTKTTVSLTDAIAEIAQVTGADQQAMYAAVTCAS